MKVFEFLNNTTKMSTNTGSGTIIRILMTVLTCTDFLDLPASTSLINLSKMADLDMGKLPKVEESGERCMRRIQEFIINELCSSEAVVLPEDKLQ